MLRAAEWDQLHPDEPPPLRDAEQLIRVNLSQIGGTGFSTGDPNVTSVVASEDAKGEAKWLAVWNAQANSLRVHDMRSPPKSGRDSGVVLDCLLDRRAPEYVLTPDARWLVSGSSAGPAKLCELHDDGPRGKGELPNWTGNVRDLTMMASPDGTWLAATAVSNKHGSLDKRFERDDGFGTVATLEPRLEPRRRARLHHDRASRFLLRVGRLELVDRRPFGG